LPQTIGPFNTFFGKTLGKYILRRLERVYLRDGHGAALLKEIDKPFDIALDVSVHMEPKKIDYEIKENSIGINVNGLLFYMAYGTAVRGFEEYRNILHRLLDELAGGRYDVILVPHTYNVDRPNREDDLLAIRQLCKERRDKTVKYIDRDYDAQALKYIIGQTYFFVGSRLHSCLASLSQLNPTVGLAYSHKFAGTFKMFGQEDCAVDIRGVSRPQIGDIVAKVIDKIRSRDKIKRELVAVDPTKVRSRFE
jgi:polysaccharide pyruvyl transferase WcaK-like protein